MGRQNVLPLANDCETGLWERSVQEQWQRISDRHLQLTAWGWSVNLLYEAARVQYGLKMRVQYVLYMQ